MADRPKFQREELVHGLKRRLAKHVDQEAVGGQMLLNVLKLA
jgi:hypothetical protein